MQEAGLLEEQSRVAVLLSCVGVAPESFLAFIEWILSEHLVSVLGQVPPQEAAAWVSEVDGLRRFRDHVRQRTARDWSVGDLNALYQRVTDGREKHHRDPVPCGEYLKLLWNVDERCVECGRRPPEVALHIDHIIPVKHGGKSRRANLQFLCAACNLKKGADAPEGRPWLRLD